MRSILEFTTGFLNKLRDSHPFISGDAFERRCSFALSDITNLQPTRFEREFPTPSCFFIRSDLLDDFIRLSSNVSPSYVLVGNSDYDFNAAPHIPTNSGLQQTRFFLQNMNFKSDDSKFQVLPLGIENLSIGVNGHYHLKKVNASKKREERVFIGHFSNTHDERGALHDEFLHHEEFFCWPDRLSPKEYRRQLERFKYVLCPRGNGIDTHRFWESLYAGAIPIVRDSSWARNIKELGLPVIVADCFDPDAVLRAVSKDYHSEFDPAAYAPLWLDFWLRKFGLN